MPTPAPEPLQRDAGLTSQRLLSVCVALPHLFFSSPDLPQSHSLSSPSNLLSFFFLYPPLLDQLICCEWLITTHRRRLPHPAFPPQPLARPSHCLPDSSTWLALHEPPTRPVLPLLLSISEMALPPTASS